MSHSTFAARLSILSTQIHLFFLKELIMGTPLDTIAAGLAELTKDLGLIQTFVTGAASNTGGLSATDTQTVVDGLGKIVAAADTLVASLPPVAAGVAVNVTPPPAP